MDKVINLVLIVVISSLVGVIGFNLFAPNRDMEQAAPTPAERIADMLMQLDESMALQQDNRVQTILEDAMKLAKETGPEGPEVARVLVKYGDFKMTKKKRKEAVEDYELALGYFEKTNGMEYESVKELSTKLADYYDRRDDYDKAAGYLRRGLRAAEQASDENSQGRFYRALSTVLSKAGNVEEADECEAKAQRLIKEE